MMSESIYAVIILAAFKYNSNKASEFWRIMDMVPDEDYIVISVVYTLDWDPWDH